MKVLITGINGFVGKYLQQKLLANGHSVYGLDISGDNNSIFSVDITDYDSVLTIIEKIRPDCIVHLAAISRVDFKDVDKIYNINDWGTLNLLKSISNSELKPRFIFISSSQVYGNVNNENIRVNEDFPVSPVNHYGTSKLIGETLVKGFSNEYEIPYVVLRPFNHTGPGQTVNFVIAKIVNAFAQSKREIDLGNINTIRDFLDVRDVVDAYVKVIEANVSNEILNISSGKGVLISGVIDILQELCGYKIVVNKVEFLTRQNEIKTVIGDSTKIMKLFDWKPLYSFEDTIKDMLDFFKN